MFLSNWSVRRPAAMTAFILVLLTLGINAYRKLSIDLMPSLDIPFIFIRCEYQGASPEEIEIEIVRRIEDAVSSIDGIKHISSMSLENQGHVQLEFNVGVNVDVAATDIRENLNRIRDSFPAAAKEPMIRKIDNNATTVASIFLIGDRTADELYDYADEVLANRFASVSGVGEVRVYGANDLQLHILLNREKLTASNLTVNDIVSKLRSSNRKNPAGRVTLDEREINITFDGEFKSYDDILALEIGKFEGKRVYLRDVAQVRFMSREVRSRSFVNGKPAISFNIVKKAESNVMEVIAGIRQRFDSIVGRGELPSGMELVWFKDSGEFIEASVNDAWSSIIVGISLTALLLFLFLHEPRSTFIVVITMPVSVCVTFALMAYWNYSFNIMTLLSLGCSVGVLVTNSIVVIENIFNHIRRGKSLKEAAREGTAEVAIAVASSALTNIVVFIPVAMMKTITGRMMAPFAGVMVAATIVSLFLSFTLTPILAFMLLKGKVEEEKSKKSLLQKLFIPWDYCYDKLCRRFDISIDWTRRHSKVVLFFAVIFCLFTYYIIVPEVGMSFMPDADQGELMIRLEFPTDYNLDTTTKLTTEAAARLQGLDFVKGMAVSCGQASGGGGRVGSAVYLGELSLVLTQKTERQETIGELMDIIRNELAYLDNCIITLTAPKTMGGRSADIPARISGSDLDELERIGLTALEKIRDLQMCKDLDSSIRAKKPNINITPRRTVLQNLGITEESLSSAILGTFDGVEVGTYRIGSRSFDIRLKQEKDEGIEQVWQIAALTQDGNPLGIEVLADLQEDVRPVSISRYDKERSIWLYANVAPGHALGTVAGAMRRTLNSLLPPGYGLRMSGSVERMNETSKEFLEVIILAIILTYLLIVAMTESWTSPFLILFTIPLGFLGMYITLWFARMSMSMMGLLGGVMMIGIVVNNAILIMDECSRLIREGVGTHKAMQQATQSKFRPIVMTSIASVAGMLPMALGQGLGSELRASCGMGVAGGLAIASILTLYVIPAMYFTFVKDRVRE